MALDTFPKQEGGKLKAVASGTLPSGEPVIVNADGTVSVVTESTQSLGSLTVYESGSSTYNSAAFDSSNNKVVVAYSDVGNSSYGTVIVGTVSGTSISFGSAVVFNSANSSRMATVFDSSNNKIVIFYLADSAVSAIVGTVSGTSISFGSSVVVNSAVSTYNSAAFDSTNNKVVIAYRDAGNNNYGTAKVGTVSGTSISFGSAAVFENAAVLYLAATFDSTNNKVVIAYSDGGNSYYGTAIVGTVSGTSISFGSAVVFNSVTTRPGAATFDSYNNKVVIAYRGGSGGSLVDGVAIVGTVSGTSISFGSATVFVSNVSPQSSAAQFDILARKVVISYGSGSNPAAILVGTVSGTSISFASAVQLQSGSSDQFGSAFDSNSNKTVIAYSDTSNSGRGTSAVFGLAFSTLTSENYIGMSTGGAVADGGNATVGIVGSVSDEQSGLTAGQQYYVQTDGTLSETPADPSVLAGTAISATKLIVKT
jgi:hypothetical protein